MQGKRSPDSNEILHRLGPWISVNPNGEKVFTLVLREKQLEFYENRNSRPAILELRKIVSISPEKFTLIIIETADKKYYLQAHDLKVDICERRDDVVAKLIEAHTIVMANHGEDRFDASIIKQENATRNSFGSSEEWVPCTDDDDWKTEDSD